MVVGVTVCKNFHIQHCAQNYIQNMYLVKASRWHLLVNNCYQQFIIFPQEEILIEKTSGMSHKYKDEWLINKV